MSLVFIESNNNKTEFKSIEELYQYIDNKYVCDNLTGISPLSDDIIKNNKHLVKVPIYDSNKEIYVGYVEFINDGLNNYLVCTDESDEYDACLDIICVKTEADALNMYNKLYDPSPNVNHVIAEIPYDLLGVVFDIINDKNEASYNLADISRVLSKEDDYKTKYGLVGLSIGGLMEMPEFKMENLQLLSLDNDESDIDKFKRELEVKYNTINKCDYFYSEFIMPIHESMIDNVKNILNTNMSPVQQLIHIMIHKHVINQMDLYNDNIPDDFKFKGHIVENSYGEKHYQTLPNNKL